jgi:hypothetical protein
MTTRNKPVDLITFWRRDLAGYCLRHKLCILRMLLREAREHHRFRPVDADVLAVGRHLNQALWRLDHELS